LQRGVGAEQSLSVRHSTQYPSTTSHCIPVHSPASPVHVSAHLKRYRSHFAPPMQSPSDKHATQSEIPVLQSFFVAYLEQSASVVHSSHVGHVSASLVGASGGFRSGGGSFVETSLVPPSRIELELDTRSSVKSPPQLNVAAAASAAHRARTVSVRSRFSWPPHERSHWGKR
jgi:hypothetical protein